MRSTLLAVLFAAVSLPMSSSSPLESDHKYHPLPDTQWPLPTLGESLQPQLPDEDLQNIISQISVTNIEATIRNLVSFGTRHTLSVVNTTNPNRGIAAARDWLTAQYRKAAEPSDGRMTVDWNSFIKYPGDNERIIFPVNITSIVATLKGSEDPDRLYVVSGHYDSRNSDPVDFEGDAPGAVDEYVSWS